MTMDKTQIPPNDNATSPSPVCEAKALKEAYMKGYLKGLNERAASELHRPDVGEEPYPDGQRGTPVAQDPFFLPDAYSVWD